MDYQYLNLETEDGLAILTMNRPPANALSTDLVAEFMAMIKALEEDDGVRCLLIRSAIPKYFMVGADLRVMPAEVDLSDIDYSQPPEKVLEETLARVSPHFVEFLKRGQEMMNAVERLPKPTIAAIGGHALGGGVGHVWPFNRLLWLSLGVGLLALSIYLAQREEALLHAAGEVE